MRAAAPLQSPFDAHELYGVLGMDASTWTERPAFVSSNTFVKVLDPLCVSAAYPRGAYIVTAYTMSSDIPSIRSPFDGWLASLGAVPMPSVTARY